MSLTHLSRDEDILASLDAALRAQVRRDGVDPQRESALVRQLAERVVHDHDQRSLTGAVLPAVDPDHLVDTLVANVAGFGRCSPTSTIRKSHYGYGAEVSRDSPWCFQACSQ